MQHDRGLPLIFRLALIAMVAALGAGILYLGIGGLGIVVGGLGSTVGGFVDNVTATPSPKPSVASISDPPSLEQPTEPYTSTATADLVVTVPAALAGDPDHRIRVYLALANQKPAPIQDAAIAAGRTTVIPVALTKGINDFSVTIVGQGGESEASAVVRYVLDASPPKITITSPKDGAVVNRKAVDIVGKTQARSTLIARNAANASSIVGTAGADGTFKLSLALTSGVNAISVTATDPAGNVSQAKLSVRRGSGKLTADLSASIYQIKRAKLPESVTLSVTVTDPDGAALAGADITFTLSMPGIPTVTGDATTSAKGKASFTTTVPRGADVGQGSATVLVSSSDFGSTEAFTVISIVK
jgi:hypothetical protein